MARCPKCKSGQWKLITSVKEINDTTLLLSQECRACGLQFEQTHKVSRYKTMLGYIMRTGWKKRGAGGLRLIAIHEHRYLWEKIHGPLSQDWVIHHINGIKDDNRIENLISMHRMSHGSKMQKYNTKPMKIVCPSCQHQFDIIPNKKVT